MRPGQHAWRGPLAAVLFAAAALGGCATSAGRPASPETPGPATHWIASWGTAQMVPEGTNVLPEADWKDATLRQYIRVTLPGSRLRLRISNVFGTAPLSIEAATLARPMALGRPDIDPATSKSSPLKPTRAVPAGGQARPGSGCP